MDDDIARGLAMAGVAHGFIASQVAVGIIMHLAEKGIFNQEDVALIYGALKVSTSKSIEETSDPLMRETFEQARLLAEVQRLNLVDRLDRRSRR